MARASTLALTIAVLTTTGCITRPGMNADCRWPQEPARTLDLGQSAHLGHLVVDAELVAELVDRYRFHPVEEQRACEASLTADVARGHAVDVAAVELARARISDQGLNLAVNVPVALLFLHVVMLTLRRIERRFAGEPAPAAVTLVVASVVLSGLFVMVGEFWTSILQMVRVGSMHVGGRVRLLPWPQHEPQIFVIGLALFWAIVLWRLRFHRAGAAASDRPTL